MGGAIAGIIEGAIKGLGGIAGGVLSAVRMNKESKRQQKLADKIFAETKNKPLYELTPETLAREEFYRNKEQGPGFRFRALGQSADEQMANALSGLRQGASSGTQLMAALPGLGGMRSSLDSNAILAGAEDMDRAGMAVDKYVAGGEAANEMNWGVKLGDMLRKEQMGYDYLGASMQNRVQAFNALAGTISGATNMIGGTVGNMAQSGMFSRGTTSPSSITGQGIPSIGLGGSGSNPGISYGVSLSK
jgi:hypothetical protein